MYYEMMISGDLFGSKRVIQTSYSEAQVCSFHTRVINTQSCLQTKPWLTALKKHFINIPNEDSRQYCQFYHFEHLL